MVPVHRNTDISAKLEHAGDEQKQRTRMVNHSNLQVSLRYLKLFPSSTFVFGLITDGYLCKCMLTCAILMTHHILLRYRADEMFIMLGAELVRRIVQRRYCDRQDGAESACDPRVDLYDTDYGG